MRKTAIALGTIIILIGVITGLTFLNPNYLNLENSPSEPSYIPGSSQPSIIATNLDTPWGMVFLPDNSLLITERVGRIRLVDNNGTLQSQPIAIIDNVQELGEGGLLGITIHPDFSSNNYIYLYYTYSGNNNNTLNRVVRMTYQNKQLQNEQIIIDQIPGSSNHNGGRIKFGPDGFLYITTGDAGNPSESQNINSLAGKILRVEDNGQPAPNNPFNNQVFSYGHRNPQGLDWDNQDQLWATEHGRSGVLSGLDELNLIEKGKNYGWPLIQGNQTRAGMEVPKLNSNAVVTWAPAGAAFFKNSLFFGGLRGQTLYEAIIDKDQIATKEHYKGQFGRIRDVILSPDGNSLYITTSNQDGRGNPGSNDDRIIKIPLPV